MKKLFFLVSLLVVSFNASAIAISTTASGKLVSSDELMALMQRTLKNDQIHRLPAEYRLQGYVSTKVVPDGGAIYYASIRLQKLITDRKSGKEYWVDIEDRLNYGFGETKKFVIEVIEKTMLEHVNKWKI